MPWPKWEKCQVKRKETCSLKNWIDFSLSPKDEGLPLSHPLRCETICTSSTSSLPVFPVLHLTVWWLVPLLRTEDVPLSCDKWYNLPSSLIHSVFIDAMEKAKKDILFIWSFLCAARVRDWIYHRWYDAPNNCSQSSVQGAQTERWDSRNEQAQRAHQPPSEPLKRHVAQKKSGQV